VIRHKPGSTIEVNGFTIALGPDSEGFCEFDVPEARDDVFARLKEIPEGFLEVTEGAQAAQSLVTVDDEQVDLSTLDRENLMALAKHIGLNPHHKAGEAKLRELIVEKTAE
jgi:hypothetical protein